MTIWPRLVRDKRLIEHLDLFTRSAYVVNMPPRQDAVVNSSLIPLGVTTPTFGELLAAARQKSGKTQKEILDALKRCKSYWSGVENDQRGVPRETWPDLVKLFSQYLTLELLAEAEVRTRPVRLDARNLDDASRQALAKMLVETVEG